MDKLILLLENKKQGFERMIPRNLTMQSKVHGKKMKNHHISDFMKEEKIEKETKEGLRIMY